MKLKLTLILAGMTFVINAGASVAPTKLEALRNLITLQESVAELVPMIEEESELQALLKQSEESVLIENPETQAALKAAAEKAKL